MTITTTEDNNKEHFPKAMKFVPKEGDTCTNFIVYFKKERFGTVIDPGDSDWKFGESSQSFVMSSFVDFHGKIVLKF